MDKRVLTKPDGRALILYGRALNGQFETPSPSVVPHIPSPHLRWHPLRAEWVADFADPKSFLDVFRGGSNNNHTGWANLQYDALLHAADRTADPAERRAAMQQAEAVLLDEMPIIPLYYFTTVRLVHPAVRGWHPLPLDRHPYKHVWLEPRP